MEYSKEDNVTALVLGGHINAYGIVRSLYKTCKVVSIADSSSMISVSNLLDDFIPFDKNKDSILGLINDFSVKNPERKIVLFATADWHLEELCNQDLRNNVFWSSLYFDTSYNSKIEQYKLAEKAKVNYPKTVCGSPADIINALSKEEQFINVVKPISRDNRELDAKSYFRAKKFINNQSTINFLSRRDPHEQFLVSEVIKAHPSQVWSCLCICEKGEIVACWTGRKLSQSPWEFGVFASSVAEWNARVYEQAKALVKEGGFSGIVQPEFKYCIERDKYFLMEINFRYMMWHYTGKLAGVNLPKIDIAHSLGMDLPDTLINSSQLGQSKVYTYNTLHLINVLKRDNVVGNLLLFLKYLINPFVIHASFCSRDWKPFFKNTFGRFFK